MKYECILWYRHCIGRDVSKFEQCPGSSLNSYRFMVERIVDIMVMSSRRRTTVNWMADEIVLDFSQQDLNATTSWQHCNLDAFSFPSRPHLAIKISFVYWVLLIRKLTQRIIAQRTVSIALQSPHNGGWFYNGVLWREYPHLGRHVIERLLGNRTHQYY